MAQMFAFTTPAARVCADEAGDPAGETLRVTVVAQPWEASFSAAALASALRLRMPRAEVAIVTSAPAARQPLATSVQVRWLDQPRRGLRIERGTGDAVEFPLVDLSATADLAQVTRRAALVVAIFAEQGVPLPEAEPREVDEEERATPAAAAAALQPPPPALVAPSTHAAPARAPDARWAVSAQFGPALAIEADEIASSIALTVRGRRYIATRTAVELGAKLSGEYQAEQPPQSIGLADSAFFAGVAYETWLSPSVAIDVTAALSYTHPQVDVDGEGPIRRVSAPPSTRLGVRTGAGLIWSPIGHLIVGVSANTTFSFRGREYVDEAGQEVIGVGSLILDLVAGGGVRW